jgi:hypothetical protein
VSGNLRVVLTLVALGLAVGWVKWRDHRIYDIPEASVNGFIPVVMPDGARADTVIIFAPPNCPSKEYNRARSLQEKLAALGVPTVMSSHMSISDAGRYSQADLDRTKSVMEGTIPAVFVNGMARANPDFQQVAAEFERTTRGK